MALFQHSLLLRCFCLASRYMFKTLAIQFALTVSLGVIHVLVLRQFLYHCLGLNHLPPQMHHERLKLIWQKKTGTEHAES